MRKWLAVLCSIAGLLACSHSTASRNGPRDLDAVPAADYLVDAFQRFPLVGFSEPRHGAGGTREFLASVLHHPRFAGTVNDIVVEFGNARYQDIADEYIAGQPVTRDQLTQIWGETTVVTGVWTSPIYEGFLSDVRSLNLTLPVEKRIRVLLGDPPIDWSIVRGPADEDMNDWRDAHFAWVVEGQVMKKGRRALLWIGGAHLSRRVRFPDSLIHLLDRRFPNQTIVALSLDRQDLEEPIVVGLGGWPVGKAASVRNTALGRLDGHAVGLRLSTGTVEQNIDAAVFWDSSRPDEGPRINLRSLIGLELQRRQLLSETTTAFRGGRIRFGAETAAILPASESALQTVLAEVQRDPTLTLVVKAFADARETDGVRLSWKRARAVKDWLVSRGIASDRLEPRGCGSSRALWVGETEEERAANRKAELVRISRWEGCQPPTSYDFR